MIVLIKLILAHLFGDFLLQPDSWVNAKEIKRVKAWQLYLHSFIHLVLIMVFMWDLSFFKWALLIGGLHIIMDIIKLYFQTTGTKRKWFFIDQGFHLIIIITVYVWSQNIPVHFPSMNTNAFLLLTLGYALTQPVSVIIRFIISKWSPGVDKESLTNAGSYIGMLERMLVFIFIISGHWEAIGFLLAAKSVFRFGDLKESRDRKLTEYVMIGTLLSFGIAILAGITFQLFN